MAEGWLAAIIVLALTAMAGGLTLRWILRVIADGREKEALSQADLRLLEETVIELTARLRATADEAISELSRRQAHLEELLARLDERLAGDRSAEAEVESRRPKSTAAKVGMDPLQREVCRLAAEGHSAEQIAARTQLGRGEVGLILNLQKGVRI